MMTPIGELKITKSGKKLVGLEFGKKTNQKSEILKQVQNDGERRVEKELGEYFDGKRKKFDLEIEFVGGTEFQRSVWEEITRIPYGKVVTYKELAARVGRPRAIRAVASACGKNPVPVVVPCHRVVGSNGGLGGYSGGLWRKEWMLGHEGMGWKD